MAPIDGMRLKSIHESMAIQWADMCFGDDLTKKTEPFIDIDETSVISKVFVEKQ